MSKLTERQREIIYRSMHLRLKKEKLEYDFCQSAPKLVVEQFPAIEYHKSVLDAMRQGGGFEDVLAIAIGLTE